MESLEEIMESQVDPDRRLSTLVDIDIQLRKYTIYSPTTVLEYNSLQQMILDLKGKPELLKENLWFDFENIATREKPQLCSMFHLVQATKLHVLEENTSRLEERCEVISNYLHVALHPVDQEESFSLFVVAPHVIVSYRQNPYIPFAGIYKMIRENTPKDIESFSPGWILHCWLDLITEEYLKPCANIFEECEECDELIFSTPSRKIPELSKRMQNIQKKVIERRIDLVNLLKIIDFLTKDNLNAPISKNVQIYFKDLKDQVSFMIDKIGFSRDVLIQAQSSLLSRSAMEVHESTRNKDKFMELINGLALIALPFSIVCGVLGMNVQVPWQKGDNDDDIRPFMIVVGILSFVAFTLVYLSKVWGAKQSKK
jgi:magnesium transporter